MNTIAKKLLSLSVLFLAAFSAHAQEQAEMADRLRADGKIYVVVAIILVILAGFIAYLFSMDRKIKKLEDLLPKK